MLLQLQRMELLVRVIRLCQVARHVSPHVTQATQCREPRIAHWEIWHQRHAHRIRVMLLPLQLRRMEEWVHVTRLCQVDRHVSPHVTQATQYRDPQHAL